MLGKNRKNPFSDRYMRKGSETYKKVKSLKSLRALNTARQTIPNPLGKGKILVFGNAHLRYLFHLEEAKQNDEIAHFKRGLDLTQIQQRAHAIEKGKKSDREKIRDLIAYIDRIAEINEMKQQSKKMSQRSQADNMRAKELFESTGRLLDLKGMKQ